MAHFDPKAAKRIIRDCRRLEATPINRPARYPTVRMSSEPETNSFSAKCLAGHSGSGESQHWLPFILAWTPPNLSNSESSFGTTLELGEDVTGSYYQYDELLAGPYELNVTKDMDLFFTIRTKITQWLTDGTGAVKYYRTFMLIGRESEEFGMQWAYPHPLYFQYEQYPHRHITPSPSDYQENPTITYTVAAPIRLLEDDKIRFVSYRFGATSADVEVFVNAIPTTLGDSWASDGLMNFGGGYDITDIT